MDVSRRTSSSSSRFLLETYYQISTTSPIHHPTQRPLRTNYNSPHSRIRCSNHTLQCAVQDLRYIAANPPEYITETHFQWLTEWTWITRCVCGPARQRGRIEGIVSSDFSESHMQPTPIHIRPGTGLLQPPTRWLRIDSHSGEHWILRSILCPSTSPVLRTLPCTMFRSCLGPFCCRLLPRVIFSGVRM